MNLDFSASPAEFKMAAAIACVMGACCLTSMACLSEEVESNLVKSGIEEGLELPASAREREQHLERAMALSNCKALSGGNIVQIITEEVPPP
eukprot:CAMPEP_0180233044 /NCGR_PEP_ID=MMETSP0987-20121128/27842_1 /TAXON_ID=697907 /ORGANISM="non described non described, Strain CCMP2293" /LENGTH=91 /DNA_ID=CAMNT_0022198789 /DNA_START=75 /DNA_END=348 /DNA_ORIENTATION=-